MRQPLWRYQSLWLPPQQKHLKSHHVLWLRRLQRLRLKKAFLAGSKVCLAALKRQQQRLQLKLKKTSTLAKPAAMVAQTAVPMDAVSVAVMASAVAVTAVVADAAVAKAAAQKAARKDAQRDALKVVLKTATTVAMKAVAASAASAAPRRAPKVVARTALLVRRVPKRRATTTAQTYSPVVMASNATTAALKTASRVSHVLTVHAVSARAANVVTAQNAVTVFHAMP